MTETSIRWPNILPDDKHAELSGTFPSRYIFRSAALVLSIIGLSQQTEAGLRASYQSTASGGLLSSDGLLRAERWLVDKGWLERDDGTLIASKRCQALPTNEAEVAGNSSGRPSLTPHLYGLGQ